MRTRETAGSTGTWRTPAGFLCVALAGAAWVFDLQAVAFFFCWAALAIAGVGAVIFSRVAAAGLFLAAVVAAAGSADRLESILKVVFVALAAGSVSAALEARPEATAAPADDAT